MMTEDARFEDAPLSDRPLRLRAEVTEDLAVISALCQDAVGQSGDISWMPRKRRLILLMNRFRWEDEEAAKTAGRPFERVRTALSFDDILGVRAQGVNPNDRDRIFSILALTFEPGTDGTGNITIHMAGGAKLDARVECLDVSLADLTQPWEARASHAPKHDDS